MVVDYKPDAAYKMVFYFQENHVGVLEFVNSATPNRWSMPRYGSPAWELLWTGQGRPWFLYPFDDERCKGATT